MCKYIYVSMYVRKKNPKTSKGANVIYFGSKRFAG